MLGGRSFVWRLLNLLDLLKRPRRDGRVSDSRVVVIQFPGDHGQRLGGSLQVMTIDDGTICLAPLDPAHRARSCRNVSNGDLRDFGVSHRGDLLDVHALIHKIVRDPPGINNGCVVVEVVCLDIGQPLAAEFMRGEVLHGHEGEVVRLKIEIAVVLIINTSVAPALARNLFSIPCLK